MILLDGLVPTVMLLTTQIQSSDLQTVGVSNGVLVLGLHELLWSFPSWCLELLPLPRPGVNRQLVAAWSLWP